MDLDLTPFFKTKAQATDFTSRLAGISAGIYETNFNLEQALLDEFGITKKDKFMTLLRNNKVNPEKAADLKAFFTKIQETSKTLPVLSLTIAFEPKDKTLQALSEWFVMNIKKQMLFEITVDRQIIGGAAINYKGKFLDATVKPVFDKILLDLMPTLAEQKQKPEETNHQTQQPAQSNQATQ
jgi:hypothetical protein